MVLHPLLQGDVVLIQLSVLPVSTSAVLRDHVEQQKQLPWYILHMAPDVFDGRGIGPVLLDELLHQGVVGALALGGHAHGQVGAHDGLDGVVALLAGVPGGGGVDELVEVLLKVVVAAQMEGAEAAQVLDVAQI